MTNSLEAKVDKIEMELKEHINIFDEYRDGQDKCNIEMMSMLYKNTITNEELSKSLSQVEVNTRPIVQLSKEIEAASRLGKKVRTVLLVIAPIFVFFAAAYSYVKDYFAG